MRQTVVAALMALLASAHDANATCGPGNVVTYSVDLRRKTVSLATTVAPSETPIESCARPSQRVLECHDLGGGRSALDTIGGAVEIVDASGATLLRFDLAIDALGARVAAASEDRFVFRGEKDVVAVDVKAKKVLWRRPAPASSGPPIVVGDRVAFGVLDWKAKRIGVASLSVATGASRPAVMGPIGKRSLWFGDRAYLSAIDATHVQLRALSEVCIAP